MKRLHDAFARAKDERRAAFIPYITAGDPGMSETAEFVDALAKAGADIVELGIPFSDPIADGKVNQRAAERALDAGATLAGVLESLVPQIREKHPSLGIVIFTYFNPLLQLGLEEFANRAVAAGADGVLVVDLPPEEAGDLIDAAKHAGLGTIFLASPTTAPERMEKISNASSGFVYYVSRLGVTGERAALSDTLAEELGRAKKHVDKPIAVGFGISTPEHAAQVAANADAVIVGSALVRLIAEHGAGAAKQIQELAGGIVRVLKRN